jgi:hypothetical protein
MANKMQSGLTPIKKNRANLDLEGGASFRREQDGEGNIVRDFQRKTTRKRPASSGSLLAIGIGSLFSTGVEGSDMFTKRWFADRSNPCSARRSTVFLAEAIAQDQNCQIAPASPQSANAWHPIAFTVEVAAQSANPQDRLTHGRHRRVGLRQSFLKVPIQGPPGQLTQDHRTRCIGFQAGQVPQGHNPHRDRRVQDRGLGQSLCGFQFQSLDSATTLERQVIVLNTPTKSVNPQDLQNLFAGRGGFGGPKEPVQRLNADECTDFARSFSRALRRA